jgi:hypothetical protein
MHKVQKARELLRAISIANSSTLCCSALAVKLIQLTSDGFSNKNSCLVVTRLGAPMDKGVQSTKSVLASNSYRQHKKGFGVTVVALETANDRPLIAMIAGQVRIRVSNQSSL